MKTIKKLLLMYNQKIFTTGLLVSLILIGVASCTPQKTAENAISEETSKEITTNNDNDYIVDEEEDANYEDNQDANDENSLNASSEDTTSQDSKTTQANYAANDDKVTDVIAAIKRNLNNGNYPRVIELSEEEDSFLSGYYRGIAYYIMSIQPEKYEKKTRQEYTDLAIENLKNTAYKATQESLKARGLLWFAIANHVGYRDLTHKKAAIAALYKFEKTSLKDSSYHNDALFYSGLIYAQMGWYGVARNYMNRVADSNSEDLVYDYTQNKYLEINQASERGLEILREYMDGVHKDYK